MQQLPLDDPRSAESPIPSIAPPAALAVVWRKLAFWMRVTALLTFGFGGFQLFIGIFNFGWGTVAGILEIGLSVLLFLMANQASSIGKQPDDRQEIDRLAKRLVLYFRLQALFILIFAFVVVMLVLTIIQFLTDWDWLVHLVKTGKKLDKSIEYVEKSYNVISGWFK